MVFLSIMESISCRICMQFDFCPLLSLVCWLKLGVVNLFLTHLVIVIVLHPNSASSCLLPFAHLLSVVLLCIKSPSSLHITSPLSADLLFRLHLQSWFQPLRSHTKIHVSAVLFFVSVQSLEFTSNMSFLSVDSSVFYVEWIDSVYERQIHGSGCSSQRLSGWKHEPSLRCVNGVIR